MRKSVFLLLFILFFDILLARVSFAASPEPTPTLTNSEEISTTVGFGVNPGPPIGIPCGNTMCLGGEICVQYPGDKDQHCVSEDLSCGTTVCKEDEVCVSHLQQCFPKGQPTPTLAPGVTLTPTPPKIPSAPLPPKCAEGSGVFPPNSSCYNDIMETQKDVKLYEKTCIYQPVVQYTDTRKDNTGEQPFSQCGKGVHPITGQVGPGGDNPDCDVALLVNTDVKNADLGSYGPSIPADNYYSSDFLAQNYLYNALFDRPLDLSDKNREAYRTYWRLMPAGNQANLRSFIMNMTNNGQLDDIKFNFKDKNGIPRETSFQQMYDTLSKQIIFFWRFPFFRIGCLTQYPVCPEYAQAQEELIPNFQGLRDAIRDIDFGTFDVVVDTALIAYEAVASSPPFNGNLSEPYSAFVPLDHTSVRSYILKRKDEKEDNAYKFFDYFSPLPQYKLTNVSFEHVPYVNAIYQGLLSPKFGMIPALQPSWIVDKYSTPSGISDYRIGNLPQDLPEVKIAKRSFLEAITEEFQAAASNPFGWISEKIRNFFTDEDKKKGYIPAEEDLYTDPDRIAEIRQVYDNPVGCPLPLSYHVLSPKTAAKSIDDHHQVVLIPGQHLAWSYSPSCSEIGTRCVYDPVTRTTVCTQDSCSGRDQYIDNGKCCTSSWSVEANRDAKALNVLNNPKQTDIRDTVAGNKEWSFTHMMVADDSQKNIPEANIDAPIANHIMQAVRGGNPSAKGEVKNPYEPINRVSNLAQDSIHYLQNCWTIPGALQNSPRCEVAFPEATTVEACSGEAFKTLLGGQDPAKPSSKALDFFESSIKDKIVGENLEAYAKAEEETGVPCEVLAGIHFEEGGNNPDQDLQSGAPLNGRSLTESAIQAAQHLLDKAGGELKDLNTLIKALSWYNGGGNSNCKAGNSYSCSATTAGRCGMTNACAADISACRCALQPEGGSCRSLCTQGFPFPFSYNFCPPATTGYDDPYVTNWWQSPQHDSMYLLYKYDCTQTLPTVHSRPGSLTVAISLYLSEQQ